MLIRFTVENFRSFDEEVVFSLIAGSTKQHPHHVVQGEGHGIDVLKLGLIYGANASGKSNLIRAMAFARDLIVEGTRPRRTIPVEPFRLRQGRPSEPSRFEFEFVVGDKAYAYGFVLDRRRIHEEWLFEVSQKGERPLFERTTGEDELAHVTFGSKVVSKNDQTFMEGVARGTRPNQLFLTETAERNVPYFTPLYHWFAQILQIIFPDSIINFQFELSYDDFYSTALADFLQTMDTGIVKIYLAPIPLDKVTVPLEPIREKFYEHSGTDELFISITSLEGRRYLFKQQKDQSLQAFKVNTSRLVDGVEINFDMLEESDGTGRLFDLFPMLYNQEGMVYIIDEIERSLHPHLVQRFIKQFMEQGHSKSQLIFTTHESTLLDLDMIRRDEVWLVQKNRTGASEIYSLEAFKTRHDLDIRKGYLHGRFGAIPVFGHSLYPQPVEE